MGEFDFGVGKSLFGMGKSNEGVGKLNLGVGIFQSEVAKLNFTRDPLPPKLDAR